MRSSNPEFLLTKATLLLVSTLTVMAGATIAPSLPAMQVYFAEVNHAALWVRLVLTIPALFIVIGSPIAGTIVDRLGRKPLLMATTALYGLAGSSGYWLDSLGMILVGRAFLGLAVAGIMVSATTLIADYYIGQARATFMGLQAAFMGFGGVLFLTCGGYLADLNWRFPFLIYLFAWILLPFIALALYEPQKHEPQKHEPQKQPPPSEALIDRIGKPPIATPASLPINLLVLVFGTALVTQIIFYLIPVQLPFHLKSLVNANAIQSGLAIAFATLFSSMASLSYGKVKQKLGYISILVLALGLLGIGYGVIGLAGRYGLVLLGLAIAGLGLGLLIPNMNVWVASSVSDAMRGRALGGLTTFFFLGQFLSPLVSQPLSQQLGLGKVYLLSGLLLLGLTIALATLRRQVVAFVSNPATVSGPS
jgi:MFS family permease